MLKDLITKTIIYQKALLRIIMPSSMERPTHWLWYKTIRRNKLLDLTAGQVEDYTTGCLLNYEHIKNNNRWIAVDLSGQK